MGKVVNINGDVPVEDVLEAAKVCSDVIVIGWKGDDFYMAMSNGSVMETSFLLELAKKVTLDSLPI